MKNKTVFQIRDKVFDYAFGWGEVKEIGVSTHPVLVYFAHTFRAYTEKGALTKNFNPTLSFTEYKLEGFSQERPMNYDEYIGKWGVFWDNSNDYRLIDKLECFEDGVFQTENLGLFQNFKPLTDEQIKELEL